MKFFSSILIAIILSCSCIVAQDGLSSGSGKFRTYAENYKKYEKEFTTILQADSTQATASLEKLKSLAVKNKDKELELQTEFISICCSQIRKFSTEEAIEAHKRVLKEAEKHQLPRVQLRTLYWITELYEVELHKPAVAAEYFKQVEKLLPLVTWQEFPDKGLLVYKVGENYYLFGDYERAIPYFRMTLENPLENDLRNSIHNSARNTIGLCYMQMEQPDSALYWFGSILEQPDPKHIWEVIAKANMGKVYHSQGDNVKAIPLLKFGREKTIAIEHDYGFAAGCCIPLADIYLRKKDLAKSRYYIDLAKEYIRKSGKNIYSAGLYSAESRYYSYTGQPDKASTLLDSALQVKTKQEKDYNALLLMRVEQKEATQLQQQKEEELALEKEKRAQAQFLSVVVTISLIVVCFLLSVLFHFYHQKRKAYQTLVQRIQQWAHAALEYKPLLLPEAEVVDTDIEYVISEQPAEKKNAVEPDGIDRNLFEELQQHIQNDRLYRIADITLEEIARRMNVNRTYLSQAVNRCTGKNFATFMNEFRIKEAVKLISDNSGKLSLEGIAFESGFNDRKTFYTAFKKITGLSPSEFRNNLQKK